MNHARRECCTRLSLLRPSEIEHGHIKNNFFPFYFLYFVDVSGAFNNLEIKTIKAFKIKLTRTNLTSQITKLMLKNKSCPTRSKFQ